MKVRSYLYHEEHLIWVGWCLRFVMIDRWPTESDWVARSGRWNAFGHTAEKALHNLRVRMMRNK